MNKQKIVEKKPIMQQAQHAFTLIELLIVVVLISIFLTASIPRFMRTYKEMYVTNIVRSLETIILYAQEEALLKKKLYGS